MSPLVDADAEQRSGTARNSHHVSFKPLSQIGQQLCGLRELRPRPDLVAFLEELNADWIGELLDNPYRHLRVSYSHLHHPPHHPFSRSPEKFTPSPSPSANFIFQTTHSTDPTRAVRAHHYCTHLRPDLHQCVIYDSDKQDARLVGVEYVVPKETFERFDEEEKKVRWPLPLLLLFFFFYFLLRAAFEA
jgi:hypothetical protein